MKSLIFVLLIYPFFHFGQNKFRPAMTPSSYHQTYGVVSFSLAPVAIEIKCYDYNCVIERAKIQVKLGQYLKAMENLNCARYYTNSPTLLIDSLSIDIIKRLLK
jgi:hypothetical protein